jgi:hypothetical protein
VDSEEEDEKER